LKIFIDSLFWYDHYTGLTSTFTLPTIILLKIQVPANKEMGNGTKQSFFKGRCPNRQKAHEKMLTIPGHKGNANQNHTKIPPHSC
jgi:hypothetical protein